MLAKKFRLAGYKIPQVVKSTKSVFSKFFKVKFLRLDSPNPQFCFLVSKKNFKKAVDRNLIKRRLTEVVNDKINQFPQNYAFIFFINKEITNCQFTEIEKQVNELIIAVNQVLSKNR